MFTRNKRKISDLLTFLRFTSDKVIVLDKSNTIVHATSIYDYNSYELLGKNITSVVPDFSPILIESYVKKKNNVQLFVPIRTQKIKYSKRYHSLVFIDEQTLYKHFFNLNANMLCIANQSGYFINVNKNFEKVLGFSSEVLLSRPFNSFVHPDDKQETTHVRINLRDSKIEYTNRYITKNRETIWLCWTAFGVGELIYATARDVTVEHTNKQLLNRAYKILDDHYHVKDTPRLIHDTL